MKCVYTSNNNCWTLHQKKMTTKLSVQGSIQRKLIKQTLTVESHDFCKKKKTGLIKLGLR